MTMASSGGGTGGDSQTQPTASVPSSNPSSSAQEPRIAVSPTVTTRSPHTSITCPFQGVPSVSGSASTGSAAATAAAAAARSQWCDLPAAETHYDILSEIGNGAYGTVYRGRDRNNADRYVALKKLRLNLDDHGVPVVALREIGTLKQLEKSGHPNIVRLLDICLGRMDGPDKWNLVFVFEYVEQDLDKYLKSCPSPGLGPETIKHLMHQILCGVDFLHTNRIIHRDLKPQNILVTRNSQIKIADFGLARLYDFKMILTTKVVTLYYRAPEILLIAKQYATPVDIWSCGCIFAELYRRSPLFEGKSEGDQLQQIFDVIGRPRASDWPDGVSISLNNFRERLVRPLVDIVPEITEDAAEILMKLLKFVPTRRWSAQEALNHRYFRSLPQPRVTANCSRSNPTQSTMGPVINPSPNYSNPTNPASNSPPSHLPRNYTAPITTASQTVPSATEPLQSMVTNDENNPNAGNSSTPPLSLRRHRGSPGSMEDVLVPQPNKSGVDRSSNIPDNSAIITSTSETSPTLNDSSMSVSSSVTEDDNCL